MPIKRSTLEVTVEKGTNEFFFFSVRTFGTMAFFLYIISVGIKNILSRLTSIMLLVDLDINAGPIDRAV